MFTRSENIKDEYCAQVVKIGKLEPIENSDFLVKTMIGGAYQVVVGKNDVKEGDIMIYCKLETAINADFLSVNNQFELGERLMNQNGAEVQDLIDAGKMEEAKKMVGYFNKHGRVRIVKLRGCPSEGCLFTIDSLVKWNKKVSNFDFEQCFKPNADGIVEPFNFDTIDGQLFLKAYVPKVNEPRQRSTKNERKRHNRIEKFDRMIENQWHFHYDTQQIKDNMWRFNPESVVCISNKLHGCVERNTIVNTMEYGDKTIGEIVDDKIDCHIKAMDTDTNSIVYVPIDNFYMIPNDGEWYEIELEDGRTITITGNNPVWLPEINCYRRVDELIGNEKLLID